MYFPPFLKKNDVIGICAPSAGVGSKTESFDASLRTLHEAGYRTVETDSVRVDDARSADAQTRAKELTSLFERPDVKMVMSASGGDFLFEILPYIDWDALRANPKWMCGASDPTSILFTLTTKYDIATLYGVNAGAFDTPDDPFTRTALGYLAGDAVRQNTSDMHAKVADFLPEYKGCDTKTVWKSSQNEISVTGRCIGGCIDVLKDLIGTEYDTVRSFVSRYKEDGLIWYFDNFSMSAENFYRTLLQMRYAGWMDGARAVLVGRVLFPSGDTGMTYGEALQRAFPDIPYIYEMDIGHTVPSFVMLNGAMMEAHVCDGRGYVSFDLGRG